MRYDYKLLYEKNARFYRAHPIALRAVQYANPVLSLYFACAYLFLLGRSVFGAAYAPMDCAKNFFLPALVFFIVGTLRLALERPRPYDEEGANVTPLRKRRKTGKDSFPSRHIACAVTLALLFCSYSVVFGAISLVLALLLAYARFAVGLHYPSDLVGGIVCGALVGLFAFLL